MDKIYGGYYIKARKIQESEIAHCAPCVRELWDYLIMNANHKENKYCGFTVKRGQLFRTIKEMRNALHWKVGYRKMTYSEDVTKTAMKTLRRLLMITSTKTPRGILITICNYDYYQNSKNYVIPKEIPNEIPSNSPVTPLTPPSINKNNKNVNNEKKEDIYIAVFDFWNSKEIIIHHKLTDKIRIKISGTLKDRKQDEIIKSIENYATVLKSDKYFWTHEWTLVDFLSRGLDKFIDEAHPLTNFLNKEKHTKENLIL